MCLQSALEFTKRITCFIFSDPMGKGVTSIEGLLYARHRTGCLFTFISCQFHNSLHRYILIE